MLNTDQAIVFSILGIALVLFVWNRIRFDLVALIALLAVSIAGIVPVDQLFDGFGHPAVVTVAAVLVISQGLVNGGVVDRLARLLGKVGHRPTLQVLMLTSVVALCSGFINNVGALALLMPVAVWMSREAGRSPSLLLMPLAFGSLLGGTMTLIGTPPNIIIASYREAGSFGMFDFAPVGLAITLAGIGFITLVGWRLTPRRGKPDDGGKLFSVGDYVTELRVPEDSSGMTSGRWLPLRSPSCAAMICSWWKRIPMPCRTFWTAPGSSWREWRKPLQKRPIRKNQSRESRAKSPCLRATCV